MLGTAETEAQKEHFVARNARRRCLKKKFEGIHDRFLKDSTYRDSQLKIGWTEETCIAMDNLAQEDHSYCPLPEEFDRYRKNLYITQHIRKKCTHETPIRLPRSTYKYAPSPPWIWRRATRNQFLSVNTKGGIRRLLHPVPDGASGTNTGGSHKLQTVSDLWAHGMSSRQRTVRLVLDAHSSNFSEWNFDDFNLSSNVHSPRQEAWLYIFEDNEAVIKMIF